MNGIKGNRMFESKYAVPRNIDKLISKLKITTDSHNSYIKFLKKYNVIAFDEDLFDYSIDCQGESLSLDVMFGFSKKLNREDVIANNRMYLNRIPNRSIAIASLNYGDLLCLYPNGKVYHWDHEVNDLYFDMTVRNGYLEQNLDLKLVANSFDEFLTKIIKTEIEGFDPNVPYSDDYIDFLMNDSKYFFMSSKKIIQVRLKKLELSEKGRELIAKFKREGLIR